jgi:CTP-dependent riboflavin kinase
MKDGANLSINVIVKRIQNSTGKILSIKKGHNLVVNTGKDRVRDFIRGQSVTGFTVIGIGEGASGGTGAPAVGDTALEAEVVRETAGTITAESGNIAKYVHTFTFASGVSYTITEIGLFDSLTESGSTMLNRYTSGLSEAVDGDTDLEVTIQINVN